MPRAELTFILEDPGQPGILVDNARAFVFTPGTTDEITLFADATGIDEVTQPIFSGPAFPGQESGQFRAWLPEAISIDLAIDDNDDLAMEATPPFDPVSFAPFTVPLVVNGTGLGNVTIEDYTAPDEDALRVASEIQPTIITPTLVAGVGSVYTTKATTRRLTLIYHSPSDAIGQQPTLAGVQLARTGAGTAVIQLGTLGSPTAMPQLEIKTFAMSGDVSVIEEE